jgi:Tol biopolymer transport system component
VAWSPDGKSIATSLLSFPRALWEKEQFGAFGKSQYDIHVIAADGSRDLRVTDNPRNDMWACWWPGGKCLIYTADQDGASAFCFVRADGTDRQAVKQLTGRISQPSISPDGKKLVFMRRDGAETHIYLALEQSGAPAPVRLSSVGPHNWNPVWSPDGTRILFYSDREGQGRDQIFVVRSDGTHETRLTNGEFNNIFPGWSPDGTKVIFGSDRDGKDQEGIFAMNADGSNVRRLIPGMRAQFARWSPDGTRVAFVSGQFPDTQIYVADANGANPTRVTR